VSALLAYFGHHKCATQWLKAITAEVCASAGRELVVHSGRRTFGDDLASSIADPGNAVLCYLNAEWSEVERLGPLRGFHVVRDPRDIVVSAYFSHLNSHPDYPGLAALRDKLREAPKDEGLLIEIDSRAGQFAKMIDWDYTRSDILELKMEEVTADAGRVIPRIVSFLGLGPNDGLDQEAIAEIVERNRFEVKAGRPPGTEDPHSHYRKGVAGDWVGHFTDRHVEYFKDRYNDVLLKLGYEDDPDWSRPLPLADPSAAV
jgi:hypothetical protein